MKRGCGNGVRCHRCQFPLIFHEAVKNNLDSGASDVPPLNWALNGGLERRLCWPWRRRERVKDSSSVGLPGSRCGSKGVTPFVLLWNSSGGRGGVAAAAVDGGECSRRGEARQLLRYKSCSLICMEMSAKKGKKLCTPTYMDALVCCLYKGKVLVMRECSYRRKREGNEGFCGCFGCYWCCLGYL